MVFAIKTSPFYGPIKKETLRLVNKKKYFLMLLKKKKNSQDFLSLVFGDRFETTLFPILNLTCKTSSVNGVEREIEVNLTV